MPPKMLEFTAFQIDPAAIQIPIVIASIHVSFLQGFAYSQ